MCRLLGSLVCEVLPLDDLAARSAGQLCGATGTDDITDAAVALTARQRGLRVITSDGDDIRRLDGRLDVVAI